MKISVTITVEIDPEDWTTTFGVENRRDIRAEVKSYIGAGVQDMGVFGNGEVQAKVDWK